MTVTSVQEHVFAFKSMSLMLVNHLQMKFLPAVSSGALPGLCCTSFTLIEITGLHWHNTEVIQM